MNSRIFVCCPDYVAACQNHQALVDSAVDVSRKAEIAGRDIVVGLELRLALLMADEVAKSHSGPRPLPLYRFIERPATEPVAIRYWPRFLNEQFDEGDALAMVREMTSTSVEARCMSVMSAASSDGVRSVYPDPVVAAQWLSRIRALPPNRGEAFGQACFCYAEAALSHPFTDGNGRLARMMFQASLARTSGLHMPVIPLGPIIYLYHKVMIANLVYLSRTGDWTHFVEFMSRITRRAITFSGQCVAKAINSGA
ncbi:Fic family protein [Brevundimonas sp.]|uniref:Fic family protein n=1 Tax=Brevundimonas sp. TaxID=1871086 RepID=UPI00391B49DF